MNEKKFKIGKARNCDIIFDDETVSRIHAELTVLQDGKIFLTDCNSKNGTYLVKKDNLKKIHQEIISLTDVIQFGKIRISAKKLKEYIPTPVSFDKNEIKNEKKISGKNLIRAECGHIIQRGSFCKECGI